MFAWFSLGFNAFQLAAAGTAMVSLPIVIHLINRMRFRRIRWAAMEFLLKAQKRQRRRLIIEQLILLAMRCLLIFMVAYWLGSFVGFGGDLLGGIGSKQVLHVVVLDDRPNMGDAWKERNKSKDTAFDEAKTMLRDTIGKRILESANRNGSSEYLIVYRLSDIDPTKLENPDQASDSEGDPVLFADRLNANSLEELKGILGRDTMKPSSVRLSPQVAMDKAVQVFEGKAKEIFDREGRQVFYKKDVRAAQRQFYFLSGFREVDWKPAGIGDKATLRDKVDELVKKKIKMYGVDTLDPVRADRSIAPQNHENIALTSFYSEAAVASEFEPITFTLVVNNFANHRFEGVQLTVTENGVRNQIAPPFLNLKPGENTFTWKSPLRQVGFNNIQAQIEDPEGLRDQGLEADNTRYTVVKVEKLVHILCVDLDYPNFTRDKEGRGDSSKAPNTTGTFYLSRVLPSGYVLDSGRLEDLDKPTLFRYPCVFIMNAPELSKDAIDNLDRFANEGGGVCFFLGDKVKPEEYNRNLFKGGDGIFPAPLDPRIRKLEGANDEEKQKELLEQAYRIAAQEPSLFPNRDEKHPMFASVYDKDPERKVNTFLMFFYLKQYFSVDPTKYKKVGKDADRVEELFTLPNRKLPVEYRDRAQRMMSKVPAGDDPAWAQFQPTLNADRREILAKIEQQGYAHLFDLANDLYKFRQDAGNVKAQRPSLEKFWADARNDELRKEIDQFIEDLRYGDPFLVGKQVGKGRVLVCMSSANDSWNNWVTVPGLYVPFMPAVVKYLFRQAETASYECGTPLPEKMMHLDAKQYGKQLEIWKMPDPKDLKRPEGSVDNASGEKGSGSDKEQKRAEGPSENDPSYETKLGWTLLYTAPEKAAENGVYKYEFRKANDPGVYVVKRFPLAAEGAAAVIERKGMAFNIDATHEGDLRRTATEVIEKKRAETDEGPGFYLVDKNAKFTELAKKQANFSESPWFYLAMLLLLIAEQAMAVHCGHHTRATDVPASAEISMHTGRAAATAA